MVLVFVESAGLFLEIFRAICLLPDWPRVRLGDSELARLSDIYPLHSAYCFSAPAEYPILPTHARSWRGSQRFS